MPPKKNLETSFRVNDTPYGRAQDLTSRGKVFVPQIVQKGVDTVNAAQGVFVRASRNSDEIITVQELHTRCLEAAKKNAPANLSIELEEARVLAMDDARSTYNTVFREGGFAVTPNESFNRWIFESLVWEAVHEEYSNSTQRDPLLPTACRLSSGLLREMLDDKKKQQQPIVDLPDPIFETLCSGIAIRAAQMVTDKASRLHAQLDQMKNKKKDSDAASKSATLVFESQEEQQQSSKNDDDANNNSNKNAVSDVAVISEKSSATTHEILAPYAEKFTKMFGAFNSNDNREILADRLYCMLQRYRALARGPNRDKVREGSGHHSATPPTVLNKLKELVGIQMECFASPFNSHFPYFCSAFRDTDCFFGSIGSFFEFFPVEGSFEVGPPYVEELMEDMRVHLVNLLKGSDRPLSFTMIVPDWVTDNTIGDGKTVRKSPAPSASLASIFENRDGYTKLAIHVKDHAFLDGFQHTFRRALFRPPNPTLVMIMQNEAGAKKWPVSEEVTSVGVKHEWAEAAKGVQEMVYFVRKPNNNNNNNNNAGGQPQQPHHNAQRRERVVDVEEREQPMK